MHWFCLLICSLLGCSFAQLTEKPINLLGLQGANSDAPKQTAGYFKATLHAWHQPLLQTAFGA